MRPARLTSRGSCSAPMSRSWAGIAGLLVATLIACSADEHSDASTGDLGRASGESATVIETLHEACAAADWIACDVLFLVAGPDVDARRFGDTCGERMEPDGWCAEVRGDAPDLGDLRSRCGAGDMFACDALYAYAPIGSPDEAFGFMCGGGGRGAASCMFDPDD